MEQTSKEIDKIAAALPKMQSAVKVAKKNEVNPHFKSRYADLADDWDACREALSTNGFSVVQVTEWDAQASTAFLRTILLHESGQWLSGIYPLVPSKPDPQGLKSAVTYARRAALEAIIGLAAEDDDGNRGSEPKRVPLIVKPQPRPAPHFAAAPPFDPNEIPFGDIPSDSTGPLINLTERRKIFEMAEAARLDVTVLNSYVKETFHVDKTSDLDRIQYNKLLAYLNGIIDKVISAQEQ